MSLDGVRREPPAPLQRPLGGSPSAGIVVRSCKSCHASLDCLRIESKTFEVTVPSRCARGVPQSCVLGDSGRLRRSTSIRAGGGHGPTRSFHPCATPHLIEATVLSSPPVVSFNSLITNGVVRERGDDRRDPPLQRAAHLSIQNKDSLPPISWTGRQTPKPGHPPQPDLHSTPHPAPPSSQTTSNMREGLECRLVTKTPTKPTPTPPTLMNDPDNPKPTKLLEIGGESGLRWSG